MNYYLCLLPIFLSTACVLLPYNPPKGIPDPASVALERKVLAVPGFQYFYRASDLPSDLKAVLVHAAKTDHIANPGEPFNATDYASDISWPFVQHQFSAVSDAVGIVVYRQGGFASFQRVLIVERGGSRYCSYFSDWYESSLTSMLTSLELGNTAPREQGKVCRWDNLAN